MSAIIFNFNRELICATCLSHNGQLIAVRDSQACILSYSELHLKPTDKICWFCHDFVQRMVAFKFRAQQAQAWLQNMANEQQDKLACAPPLTNVSMTVTPYGTATDPLISPHIKPEPDTINRGCHELNNKASSNRLQNLSVPHILQQSHSAPIIPGSINSVMMKPKAEDKENTDNSQQNMACYQTQHNQNRVYTPVTSYSPMLMKCETDENNDNCNFEALLSPCKLEQSYCGDFAGPMKPKSESNANYNNVEANENTLQQNTGSTTYEMEKNPWAVTAKPVQIIKPRVENNIVNEVVCERNTNSVDISVFTHQKVIPAAAIKNKTPDTAQPDYIYTEKILTEGEMTQWRQIKAHTEFYARGVPTERCEKCIEPFDYHVAKRAHAKSHTEAFGELVCHICQQRTIDKPAMDMHTKWHYRLLKCRYCPFVWDDVNTMRRHCREMHSIPQVLWDCDRCERQLPSLQAWRKHERNHKVRETANCPVCRIVLNASSLKTHVKLHTGEKTLKTCPDCGKPCRGEARLRSHIQTHQTKVDETAFCAECNVQYRSQKSYRIHLKGGRHLAKDQFRFECHDCGKKFATIGQIRTHMDIHTDTKYPCEQCTEVYNTRYSRGRHRRLVHERRARQKYICDECGKVYTIKRILLEHINSHTGARPYVCKLCGDTFGYKSALYLHGRYKHNIQKKNDTKKNYDKKKIEDSKKMKATKTKHKKKSESK